MSNRLHHSHFEQVTTAVIKVFARRGVKVAPAQDDDLRDCGLSSLDTVNLMLAVESECGVVIPTSAMTPQNFRSIATIEALVASLAVAAANSVDAAELAPSWAPRHA